MTYYIFANNEIQGPSPIENVIAFAKAGMMVDDTPVKASDSTDGWNSWGALKKELGITADPPPIPVPLYRPGIVPPKAPAEQTPITELSLLGVRDRVRSESAYSGFRTFLVICWLGAILSIVVGICCFLQSQNGTGAVLLAAGIGSMFSTAMVSVLIDIADALLKQLPTEPSNYAPEKPRWTHGLSDLF